LFGGHENTRGPILQAGYVADGDPNSCKRTPGDNSIGLLSFTMKVEGLMDTTTIIERLDAEISRLQQVRALLTDGDVRKGPGRPKASGAISKPVDHQSPTLVGVGVSNY
jgi:hypothetical protein